MHKQTLIAVAFCAAVLAQSPAWAAGNAEDSVNDARNGVVTTKHGVCVRTKWQADNDVCAPKKEEPVAKAPEPVAPPPPPAPPPPQIALEQRTVNFDFDKDALTAEATAKLDTLAQMIQNSRQIKKASVVGYTDVMGTDGYNIKLSERRAAAVNAYLAQRISIPTEVLSVRGLGKSATATCKQKKRTERIACLAQDRRVEVELTYEK